MPTPSRFYTEPPYKVRKTVTFTGASGLGQAGTNASVFTVTGEVVVAMLVPYCTDDLTEAAGTAQVSLGVTNAATLFIAATDSTVIDTDEFWVDTDADAYGIAIPAELKDIAITEDIIVACSTQNTDGGTLEFTCYWWPLSDDGAVEAA